MSKEIDPRKITEEDIIAAVIPQRDERMEPDSVGLPPFSSATIQELSLLYGTHYDQHTFTVAQGLNHGTLRHPYYAGREIAEGLFESLAKRELLEKDRQGGQRFVREVEQWLDGNFPSVDMKNAATIGMGIILKAYEVQNGYSALMFLDEGITFNHWSDGFRKTKISSVDRLSIVSRARQAIQIPSYQVALNPFIEGFITNWVPNQFETSVRQGTQGMYHALDHVWDHAIPVGFKYTESPNPKTSDGMQ